MPFPLAHPAAVLPLRRLCPRPLCFPALVLGALTPDAGYLFGRMNVSDFSHRFVGSFVFCLPMGVLMMLLFYRFRVPVVGRLPQRYRELFLPLCLRPPAAPLALGLSLLLGAWTHQFWDGMTHLGGWLVDELAFLDAPVLQVGHRHLRVCHLVWYVSSFVGVAWLYWTYERWRQSPAGGSWPGSRGLRLRNAVLMALLLFPLEAFHHLSPSPLQAYTIGALTLAFVALAVWRLDRSPQSG